MCEDIWNLDPGSSCKIPSVKIEINWNRKNHKVRNMANRADKEIKNKDTTTLTKNKKKKTQM